MGPSEATHLPIRSITRMRSFLPGFLFYYRLTLSREGLGSPHNHQLLGPTAFFAAEAAQQPVLSPRIMAMTPVLTTTWICGMPSTWLFQPPMSCVVVSTTRLVWTSTRRRADSLASRDQQRWVYAVSAMKPMTTDRTCAATGIGATRRPEGRPSSSTIQRPTL